MKLRLMCGTGYKCEESYKLILSLLALAKCLSTFFKHFFLLFAFLATDKQFYPGVSVSYDPRSFSLKDLTLFASMPKTSFKSFRLRPLSSDENSIRKSSSCFDISNIYASFQHLIISYSLNIFLASLGQFTIFANQ